MPVLSRPRHEAYAKGLANGMRQVDAYIAAGYGNGSTTPSCASQLANRPEIAARVLELQEEKVRALEERGALDNPLNTDETSRDWLIMQLRINLAAAQKTGKIAMANKAVELIAQLTGLLKPAAPHMVPRPATPAGGTATPGGPPVFDPAALNKAFALMTAAEASPPPPAEEDDGEEEDE